MTSMRVQLLGPSGRVLGSTEIEFSGTQPEAIVFGSQVFLYRDGRYRLVTSHFVPAGIDDRSASDAAKAAGGGEQRNIGKAPPLHGSFEND